MDDKLSFPANVQSIICSSIGEIKLSLKDCLFQVFGDLSWLKSLIQSEFREFFDNFSDTATQVQLD